MLAAMVALKRSWPRTRSLEPMIAHLTAHGLRHAFASVADDTGLSEPTIAALLGHSGGGTTRRYVHKLDPALLAAADRVAGRIADLMAGKADAGAEVIELVSATAERRAGDDVIRDGAARVAPESLPRTEVAASPPWCGRAQCGAWTIFRW